MIQDRQWYEIVITNWAQIAIILAIIVNFIQKIFELTLKKNEIRFTRLQENKILEIKSFYKSYQALELALKQYLHQTEFGTHDEEIFRKIKENIRQKLIEFDYNCMTVKLFVDREDTKTVDEIRDTFEKIRIGIGKWHIYNNSSNPPKDWNKLDEIMSTTFPEKLPALISKIENSIRRNFNLK